jgi:putative ABC transport system permease protein
MPVDRNRLRLKHSEENMFIALRELWRAKLRFGLLAAAVGLLVFLLLFLGTLSGTLLSSYIGAIHNAEVDALVFSADSRRNVQASRFDAAVIGSIEQVQGVKAAAAMSEATLTASVDGETSDLSLWAIDPGGPGDVPIVEGRSAAVGELVVDVSAKATGFVIGSTITLVETGRELVVVGYTDGRQYAVLPTGYTPSDEWNQIFLDTYPGASGVPVNLIAVNTEQGIDVDAVIAAINGSVASADAATPGDAAAATPGVSSIATSFNLIVGITFGIVVVVIGFFFTILAVQKQKSFVLLRAVGAGRRYLGASIIVQIAVTITLGIFIGILFLWGASFASSESFPLTIEAPQVALTSLIVLISSIAAGGFSVRRALKVDPTRAARGVV